MKIRKWTLWVLMVSTIGLVVVAAFTLLQLMALPVVESPLGFTKAFVPDQKHQAHLEMGGLEERLIYSPYFPPFRTLRTTELPGTSPGPIQTCDLNQCTYAPYYYRAIDVDPLWRIFWVEVQGSPDEQVKFYGPYRMW